MRSARAARCCHTRRAGSSSRCRAASSRRTSRRSRSPGPRRSWPRAADLLVNDGGGWRVDEDARRLLRLGAGPAAAVRGRGIARRRRRGRRERGGDRARLRRLAVALRGSAAARLDGGRGGRASARAAACAPSCRWRAWARPVSACIRRSTTSGRWTRTHPCRCCPRSRCRPTGSCCARRPRAGATSSIPPTRARTTTGRSSPTRCWTSRSDSNGTGWAVGGWSGEQDAAGQRLLRKGLQRARGPHPRADRGRVPLRRRRRASSRRSCRPACPCRPGRPASRSPAMPPARPRARTSRCRTSARTGRWPRRSRRSPRCARSRTGPG